jgi:phosphatidylserine/phosphatidylglycerophosphate/cardiolipin synthase-like enzyme
MIFHAIRQAQRFIYCEDQYLVDMDASNELKSRLPAIQKLIILIPHPSINTHPWIWTMCKRFVDNLGYPANRKVSVCYLKRAGDPPSPRALPSTRIPHTYVHAKMWVFDDKYAIIGSANCGRRSYTHDSEAVAGIYDESSDEACKVHFAHNLRMRLWAEHLNMGMGSVFDPIGSAAHWASPPASARVGVFDQNADTDRRCPRTPANCATENMAEPDGS